MGDELSRREAVKLAGASLIPGVVAGRAAPPTDEDPDLTGRAVLVYTRGRSLSVPIALTDCRFERQGGRLFLVGTNQPCRSWMVEWCDGTRRGIAWDAVEEYVVFDSLADYHARHRGPPRDADERGQAPAGPDAAAGRGGMT